MINKYIQFYCFIIISLLLVQCNSRTNWYENFREKEKSPFGTYIIYEEADEFFGNYGVNYLKVNIYDYILDTYIEKNHANYICIKSGARRINTSTLEELLGFVSLGNEAFISLNYFNEDIKSTLEIDTKNLDSTKFASNQLKELKGHLFLKNKELSKSDSSYYFDRNIRRNYFTSFNKANTIVLGTQLINGKEEPNFIKIYHGNGAIYLHTQPVVFTNYFMLKGKETYAENILSYLPNMEVLWDPQVKKSEYIENKEEKKPSIFKFFLKNPPLKWSLLLVFFSIILFMVFNARRKQRAIPIISVLKNSTLEFAHTIANLYLIEDDPKNAIDKKIKYFLEKVRTKYLISTNNLNTSFIEKLALKSGNSLNSTRYLINTIKFLNKRSGCTQNEFVRLNKQIENFFNQHKNGGDNK